MVRTATGLPEVTSNTPRDPSARARCTVTTSAQSGSAVPVYGVPPLTRRLTRVAVSATAIAYGP